MQEVDFNELRKDIVTAVNNLSESIKEHFEYEFEDVPRDILREFNGLRTKVIWLSGLQSEAFDSILDDNFNLKKLDND